MGKNYFNYFLYISIIFLVFALVKGEYLVIPEVTNPLYLIPSVIFLCLGFLFCSLAWYKLVRLAVSELPVSVAMASMGMSIFCKYIPGKVWMILGPAEYVADYMKVSRKEISFLSLKLQIINIWVGILVGSAGFFVAELPLLWGILCLSGWILLTVGLFLEYPKRFLTELICRFSHKKVIIPHFSFWKLRWVVCFCLVSWSAWSFGFYFLTTSIQSVEVDLLIGAGFSLAAVIGILAVVFPGGIGLREGILATYLTAAGMSLEEGVSIAAFSRLWFLFGEGFFFFIGFIGRRKSRTMDKSQ